MRRRENQVTTVRDWQLPPPEEVTWEHAVKDPAYGRMLTLSEDIVAGLRDPRIWNDENPDTIIRELPRKKHPRLSKTFGTQGWGLHITMGFSCRKFLWWMACSSALCLLCAVLVFLFNKNTQVTTALAPPGIILTIVTVILAVLQKDEDVWQSRKRRLPESFATETDTDLPTAYSPHQATTMQEGAYLSESTPSGTTLVPSRPVVDVPNFSRRRPHAPGSTA